MGRESTGESGERVAKFQHASYAPLQRRAGERANERDYALTSLWSDAEAAACCAAGRSGAGTVVGAVVLVAEAGAAIGSTRVLDGDIRG